MTTDHNNPSLDIIISIIILLILTMSKSGQKVKVPPPAQYEQRDDGTLLHWRAQGQW